MKPDWKDAPEWANWLAIDSNGMWYWYKDKPDLVDNDTWIASTGTFLAVYSDLPDPRDSLESRPASPDPESS